MKRIIAALLCVMLMLTAACGSESNTPEPTAAPSSVPERKMKVLKLEHCPYLETEATEPTVESISLAYEKLAELDAMGASEAPELTVFVDYIRNKFGIDINNRWHVLVHFYNDEKSCGMVEFQYYIGEIGTDKHFLFNLDSGIADTLYYANLDRDTDEQKLLDALDAFKYKYAQEKYELKDGEELESESVSYAYYYESNSLVYCYNVFFYYGPDRVINNDYGTTCFIDENGDVVKRGN